MSAKTIVVFLILLAGVAGGVYYYSYDIGLDEGYQLGYGDGYNDGDEDGHAAGYEEGHTVGFDAGEEEGSASGYELGYDEGNSSGYPIGFTDGYDEGNNTGYVRGVEDGAGKGYTLRAPTYSEMIAFLREDTTNENEYVLGEYECRHYASKLVENAWEQGYHSYYVYLSFVEGAHAIVAFNTTDKGFKYVEPQSDDIVNLRVGNAYWDRTKYEVDYDDVVREIILVK